MLKVAMLTSVIASLMMGTNVAINTRVAPLKERNAEIIVECERSQETLTEEGIENVQNSLMSNIRRYATNNFKLITRYNAVANAFAISVSDSDIENIKKVPGVKSVTVNKFHEIQSTSVYSGGRTDPEPGHEDDYGGSENISAKTMEKPDDTQDGAGTLVAVLDNEFYFRGTQVTVAKDDTETLKENAWKHVTFSEKDLDESKLRVTNRPDRFTSTYAYKMAKDELVKKFHAGSASKISSWIKDSNNFGKEGSLYFNKKVPFYFDYGGEKEFATDDYHYDLDVSSDISYHGSHVASIAAGNDPVYKGIAPQAQIVAMKVFTNYRAKGADKLLGYQASSGAYDIPIMNALNDCILMGVDAINMSLGSDLNDFDKDTITVKTLDKLAKSGILTSISAGNAGKDTYQDIGAYRNWTKEMSETGILSGYANVDSVMTIASGYPDKVFYEHAIQLKDKNNVTYTVAYDDQIVTRESTDTEYDTDYPLDILGDGNIGWVMIPGYGEAKDYNQVIAGGEEIDGKIAFVMRGTTSFADKYQTAKDYGAAALAVINNDPTMTDFNFHMSFGDDFHPTMPCVLILRRDYDVFHAFQGTKKLNIVSKISSDVDVGKKRTLSNFSSDGATYDLDLKPEITAPGDLIKGAVPPQENKDKKDPDRKYKVYEFLSGTSMSAPNYMGAQSVVLSKVSGPAYEKINANLKRIEEINKKLEDTTLTPAEKKALTDEKSAKTKENSEKLKEIKAFRATVNMRLMSTANPMRDVTSDPSKALLEEISSPRKQGAGMVDLAGAYNTQVYLEGLDVNGNATGKSKISLKNSKDINEGKVNLKFLAYNTDTEAHSYTVKYTVMKPKVVEDNEIHPKVFDLNGVTYSYNDKGEVDAISGIPGITYYISKGKNVEPSVFYNDGDVAIGDVYNVSRDIPYYATREAAMTDDENNKITFAKGYYYCSAITEVDGKTVPTWSPVKGSEFQSTKDELIKEVISQDVTLQPGKNVVQLTPYTLTDEEQDQILNKDKDGYTYGCYIEGYITMTSKENEPELSMPYMGYFTGGDGKSYQDAPIHEPFSFEKDPYKVYPSDLVNNLATSLLAKDKANMESLMVSGYVAKGETVDTDPVLSNDNSFDRLAGFHSVGYDPVSGKAYEDARNNIYVGNGNYSNTLIIQLFMLRSCFDNYLTITDKDGNVVYKDVLRDMLFGEDTWGNYSLYKSHVDVNYFGAGYISHRAYGIIPLYDEFGKAFESGEYTLSMNFLLSATGEWVKEDYALHIDSDAPEVSSVTESTMTVVDPVTEEESKVDCVRVNIKEKNLVRLNIDSEFIELTGEEANVHFVKVDEENSYFEISKDDVDDILLNKRYNYAQGQGRLYVGLEDKAYGRMGVVIKFDDKEDAEGEVSTDWASYYMVENHTLKLSNDYRLNGDSVEIVIYNEDDYSETPVTVDGFVLYSHGPVSYLVPAAARGCLGSVTTTSVILSSLAIISIVGIVLSNILRKKKEILGGKD